tara:strand:+ start:65 stop:676 length:612 start_codon:yes stop_codon:yes gene_type:complete
MLDNQTLIIIGAVVAIYIIYNMCMKKKEGFANKKKSKKSKKSKKLKKKAKGNLKLIDRKDNDDDVKTKKIHRKRHGHKLIKLGNFQKALHKIIEKLEFIEAPEDLAKKLKEFIEKIYEGEEEPYKQLKVHFEETEESRNKLDKLEEEIEIDPEEALKQLGNHFRNFIYHHKFEHLAKKLEKLDQRIHKIEEKQESREEEDDDI